ncbi:GNAT family N-acetyltransferase [Sutcliffiella horikoshii]|uniref:GNAT family N-acetyltransferase n=1 Tax=Sutcliffiella horikoshii TaxID=79883 RepID=A0A5D4SR66_9BACI|nr:GNAT family N-acetyltransferase [Sutcliffiella horikoshii]TYS65837.1 GNAT family N-acetyltransferase [Sutcliffiella horikoshii]
MKESVISCPLSQLIEEVATFIAKLNNQSSSHIGYCGKQQQEILAYLQKELTDVPFERAFVLAFKEETLIGLIGFDADFEQKSAEVWGPFVEEDHQDQAIYLFKDMLQLIPPEVERLYMFPNKENETAITTAANFNFSKQSEQAILIMRRNDYSASQVSKLSFLTEQRNGEMIRLHNLAFPDTYYTGEEIINRINEHRKVFCYIKDDKLAGYIYVEVEPEFSEASIEFFAVDKSFRGQSIGTELLKGAVSWIFSFKEIDELQLCVNSTNNHAIRLYQKAGFKLSDELYFFQKKLKVPV